MYLLVLRANAGSCNSVNIFLSNYLFSKIVVVEYLGSFQWFLSIISKSIDESLRTQSLIINFGEKKYV